MTLLFDLDGTLTDSRLGVTRCIQHALQHAGVGVPSAQDLTQYIGPPLVDSFATLLGTTDPRRVDAAIAAYRQRFENVGIFENSLYPGVDELLRALPGAGHTCVVVTNKPRSYAIRILEYFELTSYFRAVYGPALGSRTHTKEGLIREALQGERAPGTVAIMIGDRAEDLIGAQRNGIESIAVAWGYAGDGELAAAGPTRIVSTSAELLECLQNRAVASPAVAGDRTNI